MKQLWPFIVLLALGCEDEWKIPLEAIVEFCESHPNNLICDEQEDPEPDPAQLMVQLGVVLPRGDVINTGVQMNLLSVDFTAIVGTVHVRAYDLELRGQAGPLDIPHAYVTAMDDAGEMTDGDTAEEQINIGANFQMHTGAQITRRFAIAGLIDTEPFELCVVRVYWRDANIDDVNNLHPMDVELCSPMVRIQQQEIIQVSKYLSEIGFSHHGWNGDVMHFGVRALENRRLNELTVEVRGEFRNVLSGISVHPWDLRVGDDHRDDFRNIGNARFQVQMNHAFLDQELHRFVIIARDWLGEIQEPVELQICITEAMFTNLRYDEPINLQPDVCMNVRVTPPPE